MPGRAGGKKRVGRPSANVHHPTSPTPLTCSAAVSSKSPKAASHTEEPCATSAAWLRGCFTPPPPRPRPRPPRASVPRGALSSSALILDSRDSRSASVVPVARATAGSMLGSAVAREGGGPRTETVSLCALCVCVCAARVCVLRVCVLRVCVLRVCAVCVCAVCVCAVRVCAVRVCAVRVCAVCVCAVCCVYTARASACAPRAPRADTTQPRRTAAHTHPHPGPFARRRQRPPPPTARCGGSSSPPPTPPRQPHRRPRWPVGEVRGHGPPRPAARRTGGAARWARTPAPTPTARRRTLHRTPCRPLGDGQCVCGGGGGGDGGGGTHGSREAHGVGHPHDAGEGWACHNTARQTPHPPSPHSFQTSTQRQRKRAGERARPPPNAPPPTTKPP